MSYKDEHPEEAVLVSKPVDLNSVGITFHLSQYGGHTQIVVGPGGGLIADYDTAHAWLLPAHGDPYARKPLPKNAIILPEPQAIQESGQEKDWIARLRKLAEVSGQPVLADYYRSKTVTRPDEPPIAEQNAAPGVPALDTLCYPQGYLWWTQSNSLLFRKRDWYLQRQYEIPDSWLLTLIKRLDAQKGVPTYADVFSLLQLTPRQTVGLGSMKYRDEPAGSVTAGEYNEHDLAGFKELLTVAQALYPDHNRLLQTFILVDKDGPEVAVLHADGTDVALNTLMTSFLEKSANSQRLDTVDRIYLRLLCTGVSVPGTPGVPAGFSDVDFTMNIQANSVGGQFFIRLPLPTGLPDDRRQQTKIELGE